MASWKSSNKVAVGAVAVIVLSLGLIIFQIVRYNSSGSPTGSYPRPMWCVECDQGSVILVEPHAAFPKTCPLCDKKGAYPIFYCSQCDDFFVEEMEQFDLESHAPTCPYCGTQDPAVVTPIMSVMEIKELGFEEYFEIPAEYDHPIETPQ